jgi:plastocyanin
VRAIALLVPLLALLAAPASAAADKEIVTGQACDCFNPQTVMMDQGEKLSFRNGDLVKDHDLQSEAQGADGRPLFSVSQISPGTTTFVDGSQYLTTGEYEFVCTLHTGMDGKLVVSGQGTPAPRPAGGGTPPPGDKTAPGVKLKLAKSLKASRLAKSRRIRAVVEVDEESIVTLVAMIGSKKLGTVEGELFKGTPTDLEIRVSKKNAKLLKKGSKLTLKAIAKDPVGNAGEASLAKKLR